MTEDLPMVIVPKLFAIFFCSASARLYVSILREDRLEKILDFAQQVLYNGAWKTKKNSENL